MPFYGNDSEGFVVEVMAERIRLTAKGFWSAELAEQLVPAVVPELHKLGEQFALELDLADLRPLRDEGQAAFKNLFSEALAKNPASIHIRSASALTKLQMMRIARELGKDDQIVLD